MKRDLLICAFFLVNLMSSCADFIDINNPRTELTTQSVFEDDATAEAAMAGVYVRANNSSQYLADGWWESDVAYVTGMSADDLKGDNTVNGIQLSQNELLPANNRVLNIWRGGYGLIYQVNAVLEGIQRSTQMSQSKRKQLEGEARFMRAFTYFYLVNLFGDVPLITTTDYRLNAEMSRTSVEAVYDQINTDLQMAQQLLPTDFTKWANERTRPTRHAATALMARVALYRGQWQQAEDLATEVISQSSLFQLESISNVFLKNNREAIWQFASIRPGGNTGHGNVAATFRFSVQLTDSLINAFEVGDSRYTTWVGIHNLSAGGNYKYTYKYKANLTTTPVEYTTNLRLAEQYLIRAEARVRLNKLSSALEDINIIRNRAALSDASASDDVTAFALLIKERRVELFVEYGHRWLDLKRWDLTNQLFDYRTGWQSTDQLYPLPETDLNRNKNLVQNPGYNQ